MNADLLVVKSQARSPSSLTFDLDSYGNKTYLTHNFHPYPAKYVPQIPKTIIEGLTEPGDLVLDPFCGSGTTLVEASLLKRPSIGIDLNPIACLSAKAKTKALTESDFAIVVDLQQQLQELLLRLRFSGTLPIPASAIPKFHNRDKWFAKHVQQELATVKNLLDSVPEGDAKSFLLTAFSASIVKVSNQDSETRWAAIERTILPGVVLETISRKLTDMVARIGEYACSDPASVTVVTQCCTEQFPLDSSSIDLIVTSPPYLNSFDYYLYHKLRFFWLGIDHYSVQEKELGSRHRHCDLSQGIETYTDGIGLAIQESYRVLKAGKYLGVVIGDAILKGSTIDMGQVYRSLCEPIGFVLDYEFTYDQRKFTTSFTPKIKIAPKLTHIMCFRKS
jgi:DNA modification methylase